MTMNLNIVIKILVKVFFFLYNYTRKVDDYMNKKGFTLVELLAVIIILSLLALLASTSVSKIVKDSKSDLYDTQINLIKSAAEAWGADNLYDLPDAGTCKYLTLKDLKQYGLIDPEIKDPRTNKLFSDSLLIKISGEENKYGLNNISYEVDSNDVETCRAVYPVCTLVKNGDVAPAGISPGDKYQCKVKDNMEEEFENGYYFFVLGTNSDGTTNLIMERNIYYDSTNDVGLVATSTNKGLVAWMSETDYGTAGGANWSGNTDRNMFGPVTAMNYLYKATKDWSNVPDIVMNYIDEGNTKSYGYGTITTTNNITKITKKDTTAVTVLTDKEGYTNLKARMPRYDEVHGTGKCLTYAENGNKYGSCPLYLANYLSSSSYVTGDGLQNISGITGYWTLSSIADYSTGAWYVTYYGNVYSNYVDNEGSFGVRPVITLEI